jgi:hypothetical protein
VFHRSNRYREDNPRWGNGNAAETRQISGITRGSQLIPDLWDRPISSPRDQRVPSAERLRSACGIGTAWLIGLPRRAGGRVHAANDAEARWQHWHVTERRSGLVRWYRDSRFDALRPVQFSASTGCPCPGNR